MRKLKVRKIWIPAFLLAVLIAGYGDSDKSTGGATSPLTPPTVTSVTPPTGSAVVCPNTPVINIQQGDEPSDDQYRYVHFGRTKRGERVWDSFA
jgi:hypothetical protein